MSASSSTSSPAAMAAPRGPRTAPRRWRCAGRSPRWTASALGLDDDRGAARGLDRLARRAAEGVGVDGELLGQRALREHLDRDVLARPEPLGFERVERDLVARLEAPLEILEVDRLRVRAERLEGHRLLHVRAAQLAHPPVDRHLAALEARAVLGARARARPLLAAARGLAEPGARAAAHALAGLAAPRRG